MTRILVVDDEPTVRALVRDVLEEEGHEVLLAEDGYAGLRMVEAARPDCVVLDVMMPGLDGHAVLQRVRASERGRAFDVVASPHPSGGAVVTFDDVTEQLAMAERHRLVVETTADAIVVSDAAGVITFANPAARALFGRGDALVGMRSPELVRVVDVPRLAAQPTRTTSDAPGFDAAASRSEVAITRPDGTERLVEVSTARLSAL